MGIRGILGAMLMETICWIHESMVRRSVTAMNIVLLLRVDRCFAERFINRRNSVGDSGFAH